MFQRLGRRLSETSIASEEMNARARAAQASGHLIVESLSDIWPMKWWRAGVRRTPSGRLTIATHRQIDNLPEDYVSHNQMEKLFNSTSQTPFCSLDTENGGATSTDNNNFDDGDKDNEEIYNLSNEINKTLPPARIRHKTFKF